MTRSVHSLVALAFIGALPDGLQVRHLDGNPANNAPTNLAHGTGKENAADRERHGNHPHGDSSPAAKATDEQIAYALLMVPFVGQKRAAASIGVGSTALSEVKAGRNRAHLLGLLTELGAR